MSGRAESYDYVEHFFTFVEMLKTKRMKRAIAIILPLLAIALFTAGCCHSKKSTQSLNSNSAGPHAIIYQTRNDYSDNVPIILSDDRKSVESYPDVKDVYYQGKLAKPTVLHKGWLLDNRGINKNVAFINLSYEQYSQLKSTPTAEELLKMVIDKNPVTRMYDLGLRSDFQDIETEINQRIDAGNISEFKLLK